jgi:nucleotide-binding universal stress UspA family protein
MVPFKKILVPFSGLPLSDALFSPACTMAQAMSAELILLRIEPPLREKNGERLYSELKALRGQLHDCSVPVSIDTVQGAAEDAILVYANENSVDLIVMPRPSGDKDDEATAERVFHKAPCATLVIREHLQA